MSLSADPAPDAAAAPPPPKRRVKNLLAGALLLLLFGHRLFLTTALEALLKTQAAREGYALQLRIAGNLLTRCTLEEVDLRAKPERPRGIESLFIQRMDLHYSLLQLLRQGPSHACRSLSVRGIDVVLGRNNAQKANHTSTPETWLKQMGRIPVLWSDSLRIEALTVSGPDGPAGFWLNGGTLSLKRNLPGELRIESLRLAQQKEAFSIHARAELQPGRLTLHELHLASERVLERVELSVSAPKKAAMTLSLVAPSAHGRLTFRLDAGPLTWLLQMEAEHWDASRFAPILPSARESLPRDLSGRLDLGGVPTRPRTWRGGARFAWEHPLPILPEDASAGVLLKAAIQDGFLDLQEFQVQSEHTFLASSGRIQLPKRWNGESPASASLRARLRSEKPGAWFSKTSAHPDHTPPPEADYLEAAIQLKLERGILQCESRLDAGQPRFAGARALRLKVDTDLTAPVSLWHSPEAWAGNGLINLQAPGFENVHAALALEEGRVGFSLDAGTLHLHKLLLKEGKNALSGELKWPLGAGKEAPDLRLQLAFPELASLRASVKGLPVSGSLSAAVEGSWKGADTPSNGALQARNLRWGGFPVGDLALRVHRIGNALELKECLLQGNPAEWVRASGAITLEGDLPYSVDAAVNLPRLERFAQLGAQIGLKNLPGGGSLEGAWKGGGRISPLVGEGSWSLRIRDAQWGPIASTSLECSGLYTPGSLIISPLRLTQAHAGFTAELDWSGDSLHIRRIALEQAGQNALSGSLTLPLKGGLQGVRWAGDAEISGELSAAKLDLARLLTQKGQPPPVSGSLQMKLVLLGTPQAPVAHLNLHATNLKAAAFPKLPAAGLSVEAHFREGALETRAQLQSVLGSPLTLQAKGPVPIGALLAGEVSPGDVPVELTLSATNASLDALPSVWSGLRKVRGSASLQFHATGSLTRPLWDGQINLNCPQLHFASDRIPAVSDLNCTAEFSARTLHLRRLRAELGGGTLDIGGEAHFEDPTNPGLNLRASAREVLVVRQQNLSLRLNGELFLRGPWEQALITGRVSSTKSRIQRDLEVLPLRALRTELPYEQRKAGKPWFTLRRAPFNNWRYDIGVSASATDPFLLRGNRLHGSFDAEFRLEGTGAAPTIHGAYHTSDLIASLPFSRIEVSRGRIWFTRERPFQPNLDFSAETEVRNHRVRLYLDGPADAPHLSASSTPPESEPNLLTLLATGVLPGENTEKSQVLSGRAATLLFQEFSSKVIGARSDGERFSALRRFDLDLGAVNNRTGQQETRLTYRLRDDLFVVGEIGAAGDFAGRVRYLLRFR